MTRTSVALSVLLLLAAAPAAHHSSAIFIKIDGIVAGPGGEERGDGRIEVLTFAIGREDIAGCSSAQGAASSHSMEDVVVTRSIDKASPLLYEAAAKGDTFPEVNVEFEEGGRGCRLTFSEVREMDLSQRGDRETLTFSYARMAFATGVRTH